MTKAIKAGLVYFGIVFAAGFLMGLVRIPFLVPRFGERTAELIEMPFMLVVIILSARWLVNRFVFGGEIRRPIITGGLAAVLLLAVEFGVVLRLREISLEQYLSSRDPIAGGVYYALVAMFGLAPVIFAKLKKAPQDAEPMEVH